MARSSTTALLALVLLVSSAAAFVPAPRLHKQVAARGPAVRASLTRMMAAGVRKVNGEELEKELSEWGTPVLLDVFAQWCGPCSILAGELEKVAGLYGDKLRILKVDSDEEPRVATALKVYGLPTIFFIKNGQLIHRMEGAVPASELTQIINSYLFSAAPPEGKAE